MGGFLYIWRGKKAKFQSLFSIFPVEVFVDFIKNISKKDPPCTRCGRVKEIKY